jgi:ABC-type nitrate/sulfonate/bicarbonate transport system substrate-binding protein
MRPVQTFIFAIACQALAACTQPGSPPDGPADAAAPPEGAGIKLRVVDSVNLDVRDVPLLIAYDQLAAQGYEVEMTSVTGQLLLTETLARGEADVAVINNETAWSAITKGAGIRTVSEFTVYTGLFAAHNGIRSCRDLHGRPVGIPGPAGFAPLLWNLFMRADCPGVEPRVLVITESASRYAALLAGRVDAAMVPGEELIKLQRQSPDRFHTLAIPARKFPGIRIDGLHVNLAWATEHPQAVEDLLTAQLKVHRLVRDNPELLYEETAKRLSIDAATAKAIASSHLAQDIWDPNGALTYENVQSTIDFLVDAGSLPRGTTAAQVADLSPLKTVLAAIGQGTRRSPDSLASWPSKP